MKRFLLIALILILGVGLAQAGPPLNSQKNWRTVFFDPAPTVLVADVYNVDTEAYVGFDLATRKDPAALQTYKFDLSIVGDYPTGCIPATYMVVWKPDGADCSLVPDECAYDTVQVGGSACSSTAAVVTPASPDTTYATTVQTAQGITSQTLDFYRVKGLHPVQWVKRDYSATYDFQNPDSTDWEVYYYETIQSFPAVSCTVMSTTDPNTSLPPTCL